MPWTLLRSMLKDLGQLVALTTLVLVTVIAFGATIKPLANDSILTAWQTVKYVLLAIVPMLQFALPFAAGFAGTMSLHRMASDNEIVAAAVSGISYRRLLAPIVGLGLALMLAMVGLTNWVIPRFWGLLEQTLAQDVVRLFQASIDRGEPFQLGDQQIFADRLIVDDTPDSGATTRLILLHVAAASLDDEGRISTDVTAEQAVVDVYRRDGVTYLKMAMHDTVIYRPETGVLSYVKFTEPPTILIPSVLEDEPKNMTPGELLALRDDPDGYSHVVRTRRHLADALREAELWRDMRAELRARASLELRATGGDARMFRVQATGINDRRVVSTGGPVEVLEYLDGEPQRSFRPRRARLLPRVDATTRSLAVDLILEDCRVRSLTNPALENERAEVPLLNLVFERAASEDLAELSSDELRERAAALGPEPPSVVTAAIEEMDNQILYLRRAITSRLAERHAVSVTAMLLLVLGAVFAMWLRESTPLVIYLCAFLPSILDLVMISSGENLIRDGKGMSGAVVMWSGHLVLLLLIVAAYRRLARN